MKKARILLVLLTAVAIAAAPALAAGGNAKATKMRAIEEVPALSTPGGGTFTATIAPDDSSITWELHYFNTESDVTQAHLHFAQKGVNGGITVFLCSNLGNGPAGTQACPVRNGTISGTIHASDVIAVNSQGIGAGELFSVLRGIRLGVVYANVHTTTFPGGEVRGQLTFSQN
jgi:hypothetical protein